MDLARTVSVEAQKFRLFKRMNIYSFSNLEINNASGNLANEETLLRFHTLIHEINKKLLQHTIPCEYD